MATTNNGPLGPFQGKLGPIYGYVSREKTVLRAKPHITKPRSEKQKASEQKMAVISAFLNLITKYIAIGFKLSSVRNRNSANNSAKSYNLKNAVTGVYPLQELDYSSVRLTEGTLAAALNAQAIAIEEGFKFTWDYDPNSAAGGRKDKTMLMAFFPESKIPFYWIAGAERQQGEDLLKVLPSFKGKEAETYISFITDDRTSISNSVYTGRVMF